MASKGNAKKKRGATPKTEQQKRFSGWLWLATGLFVGLFVAFLVFLKGQPPTPKETLKPKAVEESPTTQESKTFEYDFYKLLPKLEVVVPDFLGKDAQAPDQKAEPIKKPGIYVIQAGSFRKHADADRRKANLALLGVASKIVTVKVEGNQTWHRVQIGPFEDLSRLNTTRDLLIQNKIDTLLLKVRG